MPKDFRSVGENFDTDQVSATEIASEYGLSQPTIRVWITRGLIQAHKEGRAWMVSRKDVARMLTENPTLGRPRTASRSPSPAPAPGGGTGPLVSKQNLRDHARQADVLWDMAIRAFDPLPDRMRSLADGANAQARVIHLAELAEVPWQSRDDGLQLPDSLKPGSHRDGPTKLWAAFDSSIKNLTKQMATAGNNRGVYLAFEGLRDAAAAIADALDPPAAHDEPSSGPLRQTG
jgi:hypothetical protein